MTAQTAVAVGAKLQTCAKGVSLPPFIQAALDNLAASYKALNTAFIGQVQAPQEDSPASRESDRRSDSVWGGAYEIVAGIARIPDEPTRVQHAELIISGIFPGGIAFTQLRFANQWAECETRLQRIAQLKLEDSFKELGLDWLLARIRTIHAEYGRALGITEHKAGPEPTPGIAVPLAVFQDAIRFYVLRVLAHVDPKDPETEKLADRLLAPLNELQTSTARSADPAKPPVTDPGGTDPNRTPQPA